MTSAEVTVAYPQPVNPLPLHYTEKNHHIMFLVSIHKWLGKLSLHYKELIFEYHIDKLNKNDLKKRYYVMYTYSIMLTF